MAKRTLALATIRAECHRLAGALVTAGHSRESLALLEPGQRENPDSGPNGVLRWYGLLNQAFAADQSSAGGGDEADAVAVAALAEMPRVVSLVSPLPDGTRTLSVYPKSLMALQILGAHDELMGKLVLARQAVIASSRPEHLQLIERVNVEIGMQLRLPVWGVTTPGARLPYEPGKVGQVPEWTGDLSPWDVLRVMKAHQEVNGKRLQALSALCAAGEGGATPRWSVFVAGAAAKIGVQASALLNDWSLAEVLATFRLAGEGERAAHEAAKQRRAA